MASTRSGVRNGASSRAGGWAKVQPDHFGDGGVFDQIYTAK